MNDATLYRWSITDYRLTRAWSGEAPNSTQAKAAAIDQLRRLGRGLTGISATVFRPSGVGWFARSGKGSGAFTWEEWEQATV